MAFLVIMKDGRSILRFRLENEQTSVGRGNDADLLVPDARVSRLHFIIRGEDECYRLLDRSSNGTYVNRVRTKATRLSDQDIIDAGGCQIRFELDDIDEPAPTVLAAREGGAIAYDSHYERIFYTRPVLLVRDGAEEATRVLLRRDATGIGSDANNDVVLTAAANRHFQLLATSDGYTLRNLQPKLPPTVNDEPILNDFPVRYGSTIRLGQATLKLVLEEGDEPVIPLDVPLYEGMVGTTQSMHKLFALIDRFSRNDAPVIILGETGTGKELVARALHRRGHRSRGPFVAINCSAISPQLFESELFGHEKGAFTGAVQARTGAVEAADKGTFFLDELGDLPLELQAKLLRVLETSTVTPVGSHEPRAVDVRIVAATHKDLRKAVEQGRFRADLFYRLFVLTLELPPLRKRLEDLPALVRHFVDAVADPEHPPRITAGALSRLASYHWPGNVRELRHVLTRALAADPSAEITENDLRFMFAAHTDQDTENPGSVVKLEEMEKQAIERALRIFDNNRKEAALALGIARSTLHMRLKKYGIAENEKEED